MQSDLIWQSSTLADIMWVVCAGFTGMSSEEYDGNVGQGGACDEGAAG